MAKRWTPKAVRALFNGLGAYGLAYFQRNAGPPEDRAGAAKVRTRDAVYAQIRRLYGPGGLTTGVVNSGIIAFSKYLAGELAPRNILVNNVCPGFIYTESWDERVRKMAADQDKDPEEVKRGFVERTLLGRWGEPREIADMVVFLASERAGFITGETLIVGGGRDLFI